MKEILKKIVIFKLTILARITLWRHKPRIIGVTGTVGKTSTKDAIYKGLSEHFTIRKNKKSLNSEIGVPLTILGLESGWNDPVVWLKNLLEGTAVAFFSKKYPKWLVLEIGIDHPGDMDRMNKWLKTDVVVVTSYSDIPVHVEYFKGPEEVFNEEIKLIESLKDDGVIVLNGDYEQVLKIKNSSKHKTFTFGFEETNDVYATNEDITYSKEDGRPSGICAKLNFSGNTLPLVNEGVLGFHLIYSCLAAVTIGVALELSPIEIIEGLKSYKSPNGRMKILDGINGSTIIDDSYNSSPIAVKEALGAMYHVQTTGRKIVALGDMLELGRYTASEHRKVGKMISDLKPDFLVVVGIRSKDVVLGAVSEGFSEEKVRWFGSSSEAADFLENFVKENDIVLVKGSQGTRMEKISHTLLLDKKRAPIALVRQDYEWKKR